MSGLDWLDYDRQHVWHPYSTLHHPPPVFGVVSGQGCVLQLSDGREVIDGMASWWSAIHGYRHPVMDAAVHAQVDTLAHVMFGGLTHEPAVRLAERLVTMTPPGLDYVFFADSGSVAMEVAIKMALQYRAVRGETSRTRLLTLRGGYHGDTFGAMSVCDPGDRHAQPVSPASCLNTSSSHARKSVSTKTGTRAISRPLKPRSQPITNRWPRSCSNRWSRVPAACGSTTHSTCARCARPAIVTACF